MYLGTKRGKKKSNCRHVAFRKSMSYKLILLEAVAITRLDIAIQMFTWTSLQSPFLCPGFCCNLLRKCCRSWHVLKTTCCGPLTVEENQAPGLCADIQSISEVGVPSMEVHLLLSSYPCFLLDSCPHWQWGCCQLGMSTHAFQRAQNIFN